MRQRRLVRFGSRSTLVMAAIVSTVSACQLLVGLDGISDGPPLAGSAEGGSPVGDAGVENGNESGVDAPAEPGTPIRLKYMTFEQGKAVDPSTGADSIVGTVAPQAPALTGAFSVRVRGEAAVGASYLREGFEPVRGLVVSFQLRLDAFPVTQMRLLRITSSGTTVGELIVTPTGELKIDETTSSAMNLGAVYRVRYRIRGTDGLIEASQTPDLQPFGSPFFSATKAAIGTFDRIDLGQTVSNSYGMDAVLDEVIVDSL